MPGQYFLYVPFDTPGDLDAAIDAWGFNTRAMASDRDLHQRLSEALTKAQETGKQSLVAEAQEKLQDLSSRTRRDKHGEVGLERRKVPIRLNHYDGGTPLSVLSGRQPFDYTLYIVGHCAQGSETLFNTSPRYKGTEQLKADELVARMVKDGLPKDTFNFKLLACYGASPWDKSEAFQDRLARELAGHCPRFYLRGYKEPVLLGKFYTPDTGSKKAASLPEGRVDKAVPMKGVLSDQARGLGVGTDQWPRCFLPGCGKPARLRCGSCNCTFYCSKTHLQQDRTRHYPLHCMDLD